MTTTNASATYKESPYYKATCNLKYLPQVMLRLQAKQERHMAMTSVEKGDTQVSHVAKDLPKLQGTIIKSSFIEQRGDSWQNHLVRISHFLLPGKDVWWRGIDGGFQFWDGDDDSRTDDRFNLLHFRENTMTDVEERRKWCWTRIVTEKILIPARDIKVYRDEECIGRIKYIGSTATFIAMDGGVGSDGNSAGSSDDSSAGGVRDGSSAGVRDGSSAGVRDDSSAGGSDDSSAGGGRDDNSAGNRDGSSADGRDGSSAGGSDGATAMGDLGYAVVDDGDTQRAPYINLLPQQEKQGLNSTLATCIERLLQNDTPSTLKEFDTIRTALKGATRKGKTKNLESRYKLLEATLGTQVLARKTHLERMIHKMELENLEEFGTLPLKRNSIYSNLLKDKKLATTILRNIGINI